MFELLKKEEAIKNGKEEAIKNGKEEAIKNGKEEAIKNGKEEAIKNGKEEAIKNGKEEAIKNGKEEAIENGKEEAIEKSKEADDKIIEKLAEFRKIQQQKSEILKKEEEYKLLFANYLEDSEILKDSLGTKLMSFKNNEKRFFDTTSFKKDCPEEYEKYCKSSTYRSMRFF